MITSAKNYTKINIKIRNKSIADSKPEVYSLLSLPVKGLPIVWKLFLLHSSLPEVEVLSLFFCLCFLFFLLFHPGT